MGNDPPPAVIAFERVTKVFVTDDVESHALAEVDLEIERGEYLATSGPSGCGKSTLLSILGQLGSPSDGLYRLNRRLVSELQPGDLFDGRIVDDPALAKVRL